MRPTLRQIECFQAVVELGNFSRAAEKMQTTQANLSHTIRDLEGILGTRLLDRTTRRVDMTEAGRAFAAGALHGLAEIDRAAASVRDLGQLRRGIVRIAAPPLLGATVLPRLVCEAMREYPELEIQITDVSTDIIIEQIRNGRCDLGVGTFAEDEAGLQSLTALQDRLMVFTSPAHNFARCESVEWVALRDERMITLTRESSLRVLVEIGFEQAGLKLRPSLEVHQIHTALSLAETGVGVAILPAYAFSALLDRAIIARPLTNPAMLREIRLITARDRTPSAATIAVRTMLRQILRKMVPEIL